MQACRLPAFKPYKPSKPSCRPFDGNFSNLSHCFYARASLQSARLQTVQTLQTLPQAWRRQPSQTREARPQTVPRAQVSQVVEARNFLFFLFLFTGSESNVRHGQSRPQTLQTLPQARLLYYTSLLLLYYTSLLVFLSVQKVTCGPSADRSQGTSVAGSRD